MSLLAWYPLISNGNNQGLDGVDLTTVGSVTYTAGKLGNAATFNGNIANRFRRTNFTEQTNWSVAAWVKCVGVNSSNNAQWVFNNGRDSNNDGWHCWFSAAGTTLYLRIGSSTWSMASTLSTWYHVAMTIDDNSKYTFYVNGAQVSTGTVATLPDYSESGNLMAIGGFVYNGWNIYPLNGQVQDFRYYNHVLSKKEVKELAKGLCLHLPLDWGGNPNLAVNSLTLNNSSGNSNYTHETIYYDGVPVRRMTVIGSSYGPWCNVFDTGKGAVVGDTYTWSMYIRGSNNFTFTGIGHERGGTRTVNVTTEWQYVTHTWTYSSSGNQAIVFFGSSGIGGYLTDIGNWIEVKLLKVEKGSKATPFLPNTAETIYTIDNYGSIYYEDDSGYNHDTSPYGVNNVPCTAPRGITGTTCGSGSCIILGKSIKLQCPISFAFWFNTSDLTNNNNRLISCTEGGGWNVELSGNYLCWTTGTGASSNTYKYCISTKTYTELQNAWHHIVCTYDGLKAQMYIDGVLNKETVHYTTFTPIFYNANNSVFLCAEAGGNAVPQTFTTDTSVSDFRFYATILSADDVKELYQVGAQIDKSGNFYCGTLVEV